MRIVAACSLVLLASACNACNVLDRLRGAPDASGDASTGTVPAASASDAGHGDAGADDGGAVGARDHRDAGAHKVLIDASIDPTACHPACARGAVCTSGHCVCPFHDDVLCPKGCTNPKTDNFACGCTTSSAGAVCAASQECCKAQCVACPQGQTIDPSTCSCTALPPKPDAGKPAGACEAPVEVPVQCSPAAISGVCPGNPGACSPGYCCEPYPVPGHTGRICVVGRCTDYFTGKGCLVCQPPKRTVHDAYGGIQCCP
jgi:hypothetical protein